ncbi:hypothetical protein VFPBJ_10187 [Purpureocillium lilacinum]|uniref:Uncharacterized protein n=1 Tax=Purpureocillium lilacinum TaxID=33203 RepID=A0A179GAP7_PURLI|nr:hypothetical protein VFPBJ_10187 [Purpureocillium lilacinum]
MQFLTKILALCLLVVGVLASAVAPADEVPIAWEVEVRRGEKATLYGTVQEVHAQLLERNPNWDTEVAPALQARDAATTSRVDRRNRDDGFSSRSLIVCGKDPWSNLAAWLDNHIYYLSHINGKPSNRAGGCGRVSCQHSCAVWWCNDNTEELTLGSWSWLSNGLSLLKDSPICMREGSAMVYSELGYRVRIGGADCGKK